MKPIRIFNNNLTLLAELDNYENMIVNRKFYSYGKLELNININKQNTEYLQKGNIIMVGNDKNKIYIIKQIKINLDQQGKGTETLNVLANYMSSLFLNRICIPKALSEFDAVTDKSETVIKHYIENNITNATDTDRNISILNLLADQARGTTIAWSARYTNLMTELNKISIFDDVGIECSLNYATKEIDIDVLPVVDHTSTSLNPVIFSYEYGNIETQEYINSDIDYKNVAIVGGNGEGASRLIEEVGTDTDLNRVEIFVDARDLSTGLFEYGKQLLSETPLIETLEGQILKSGPFEYEVDFDLGSKVTIQNKKWDVELDSIISEITESYEVSGFKLECVFGNSVVELGDKINKKFSDLSKTVTI